MKLRGLMPQRFFNLRWMLVVAAIAGCGRSLSPESTAVSSSSAVERVPATPKEHVAGEEVYKAKCSLCHDDGEAGAPRLGNPLQWSKRSTKGLELLSKNAFEGFDGKWGEMPPQGDDLSAEQVTSAVKYMLYRFELAEADGG